MNILITGTKGIAAAIAECYSDHSVTMVGRSTGHDIKDIDSWGSNFLNYDVVFNNAYQEFDQVKVLEYFYGHWKDDSTKTIVSIGSRCVSHKRSGRNNNYWPYRVHKIALLTAHDHMQFEAMCDLKIVNAGMVDTDMISHISGPKMSAQELAQRIKTFVSDPTIKRVDLWTGKV